MGSVGWVALCFPVLTEVTFSKLLGSLAITKLGKERWLWEWCRKVECVWNVMAHAQKPDFVFRRNGRVHLNRRGRQFSRLLAAEACAPAVVMLDTPRSEVVLRVLATHSICQFPLHFLFRASPCAIRYQTHSTTCEISSFCHSVDKTFAVLWCYAAYVGNWLPTLWDSLTIRFSWVPLSYVPWTWDR